MGSIEPGNVCIKITGREAGQYCVVLKKVNNSFVLVTGPKLLTGIKRRQCNISHLEPTSYKLEISPDAADEEVIKAFETAKLITKLRLKKPSAGQLKEKPKEEKKETKVNKTE